MEPISSRTATHWKEGRRLRAVELFEQGWSQKHIAQALGVTPGAVCQWLKKVRQQGKAALRHRKGGGPTPKLSQEQREQLLTLLERGGGPLAPEAPAAGHAAGRSRHRGLEDGALASAKKGAVRERRTLVYVDESGFYLLPGLVRTGAKVMDRIALLKLDACLFRIMITQ